MGCNFSLSKSDMEEAKLEKRILMLGLDNAGKTSLMYRIKDNTFVETVPTVGLNMESSTYKHFHLTIWDVAGKARNMWKHYFEENAAVGFVMDSTDDAWLVIAKMELKNLLNETILKDIPFLVFLNKQDASAMQWITEDDILKDATIEPLLVGRQVFIQKCSAKTGEGVWEGIDKLVEAMDQAETKR